MEKAKSLAEATKKYPDVAVLVEDLAAIQVRVADKQRATACL